MDFDTAFSALIGNEGKYSNDPQDPGGETMWGVTARVAREWGYTGSMQDLPESTARNIAHDSYWYPAHCEDLPDAIRFDVFDAAYNEGVREALMLIQRTVGVSPDGVFGPATAAAVAALDPERCVRLFNAKRLRFYTSLPGWVHDGAGWANRVATNLER